MTQTSKVAPKDFIPARRNFLGELLVFWMCRSSLRRGFHATHFRAAEPLPAPPSRLKAPIIFYSNHSSWWDGYLAHVVSKQVYGLEGYLMMDVRQLRKFFFFSWAGCFSVNQENARSALYSINYISQELKQKSGRTLWIYPQGYILPQERRPLDFHSGLAYVIKQVGACYVYPVALRYEFLQEQYPEAFMDVGKAIFFDGNNKIEVKAVTANLETKLAEQMDLLRESISRQETQDFVTIIRGKGSTNTSLTKLIKPLAKAK